MLIVKKIHVGMKINFSLETEINEKIDEKYAMFTFTSLNLPVRLVQNRKWRLITIHEEL